MTALTKSPLSQQLTGLNDQRDTVKRISEEIIFWGKEVQFLNRLLSQAIYLENGLRSNQLEKLATELDNFSIYTLPAVSDTLRLYQLTIDNGRDKASGQQCKKLTDLMLASGAQYRAIKLGIFEAINRYLTINIW